MKSIFMLAAANLRRHKGAGWSLGLMVMIAAVLLNIGLLSMMNLPRIFDQKLKSLHTPYISSVISSEVGSARQAQIEQKINAYSGVTETQAENVLYFPTAAFPLKKGNNYSNTVIVENTDEAGSMGRLSFAGARGPETNTSIFVPYILESHGYRLGDSFTLTYLNKTYHFTIAGFTEDLMWGSLETGGCRFFMPDASYRNFVNELNNRSTQGVMFSARTKSIDQAFELFDAISRETSQDPKDVMYIDTLSIGLSRLAASVPVNIGAAMEIAFAFVVALVLLLVVRFRIVNSIEEDMQNIGALEAVGYTSRQVRGAFLLQFLATAFMGSVAGVALSYLIAIPHGRLLASETGLNWTQNFDLSVCLLTLAILLLCVALVAFATTRRIHKLPVIVALRGGITTHSFRKNHMPLESMHGPIHLLLSMKFMLANARQNFALIIILAAVSFASIFTFLLFYNFDINNTAVMHVMGGEPVDILIGAQSSADEQSLLNELPTLPGITQVIDFGAETLAVDGKTGYGRFTSDFGKLKNDETYTGRYPKHDNEVAIGGSLAVQLRKGIGDSVNISSNGVSREYIITGLTQSVSNLGKNIFLTTNGVRRISPQYCPVLLNVYTKSQNNSDIDAAIHTINTQFGTRISAISNDRANTQSVFGTYEAVVAAFSIVIFVLMGFIVILILALITSAMLVRLRREFGIEKALGFTTWQLMCQVSFGYLPVALGGALAGGILGRFCANPLMSRMFRAMGIMKADFFLPAASVPIICLAIVLLTYLISMLAAAKARRISPCVLISE